MMMMKKRTCAFVSVRFVLLCPILIMLPYYWLLRSITIITIITPPIEIAVEASSWNTIVASSSTIESPKRYKNNGIISLVSSTKKQSLLTAFTTTSSTSTTTIRQNTISNNKKKFQQHQQQHSFPLHNDRHFSLDDDNNRQKTWKSKTSYFKSSSSRLDMIPSSSSLISELSSFHHHHQLINKNNGYSDPRRRHYNTQIAKTTKTIRRRTQSLSKSFITQLNMINLSTLHHNDPMYCLTMLLLMSTAGIQLERKTYIGKALSAPLVTMAIALILANFGQIIPFTSNVYTIINTYFISLAVPMLLYDSNIKRVINDTGTLLIAFFIGAFATVIGTIIAYPILPMKSLGYNIGYKVACALAARHIGGAINFIAVAETLSIPSSVISATIAADNVVVALYFTFLFWLAKEEKQKPKADNSDMTTSSIDTELYDDTLIPIREDEDKSKATTIVNEDITLSSIALSLSIASTLVTIGNIVTKVLLPKGTSSLPVTSIITVICATIFPKFFQSLRKVGTYIGILFIQMFFAASGASGSIMLVLQQAPSLFLFSLLQISIHFIVLMTIGKYIWKSIPIRELYLASNANIGGPTTAAAMAQAKHWNTLILPALLIGILGYATATPIALTLGPILLRLPLMIFSK